MISDVLTVGSEIAIITNLEIEAKVDKVGTS